MPSSSPSGGNALPTVSLINGDVVSIPICTPVYASASGSVKRARANAIGTSLVCGLVSDTSIDVGAAGNLQTGDVITATTTQWDLVAGTSGGLTFDTLYYLNPTTAGKLTSTAPSTPGQVVAPVCLAVSATQALFLTWSPIVL